MKSRSVHPPVVFRSATLVNKCCGVYCQSALVPAVGDEMVVVRSDLGRKRPTRACAMLLSSNHGFHDVVQPCERTYQRLAGVVW